MIRYFTANVDHAVRIAVVDGATDEDIYEANEAVREREIARADLPADFHQWRRYTAHAYPSGVTVYVMSRGE